MSPRAARAGLAVLLLAAALHLPVRAIAAHTAGLALGLAAAHPAAVLVVAAVLLLLRAVPGAHPAVSRLTGRRVARVLAGGGQL